MSKIIEVETDRLMLRQWGHGDFTPFAAMNSDKTVMEFFPSCLSREQSDAMALRCQSLINERGWGFWALEDKSTRRFIGFTGLHIPAYDLPFSPCVEIGWRLTREFWGKGIVTEAAQAALGVAFTRLELDEVVSFTVKDNLRSLAVMERLGMFRQTSNFEHPSLPAGHRLREHVLYKITRTQWE